MMSAFGGKGLRATSLQELQGALASAIQSALHDRVGTAGGLYRDSAHFSAACLALRTAPEGCVEADYIIDMGNS